MKKKLSLFLLSEKHSDEEFVMMEGVVPQDRQGKCDSSMMRSTSLTSTWLTRCPSLQFVIENQQSSMDVAAGLEELFIHDLLTINPADLCCSTPVDEGKL